jgi:hypothetical protein
MAPVNRRAFLAFMPTAIAGATLDPERLLWMPGQKSYHFISRPFLVGDVVFRHPAIGLTRWGLASAPEHLGVGGELGVYDGHRVLTYGPVTAKVIPYANTTYVFTERAVFDVSRAS